MVRRREVISNLHGVFPIKMVSPVALEYSVYNKIMKQLLNIALAIGFLFVDFLFFHDIFKAGETTSLAQYLTGLLSIPVIIVATKNLLESTHQH